jgi:alkanesulfonate monooxygenase SsuD/methylene tetrahydromethanopterin reductase-like flavin-dependent oxidoreductase (luciferase family)
MTGTATVRNHVTPTIRAAAEDAGNREPQVVVALPTCVTTDPDEARKRAANYFSIYGQLPSYRAMLDREGAAGPEDVAIIGTQEQVLEAIAGIEAAGATEFIIVPFFEREETLESLTSLVA